jgi:hypothetical protein
MEKKNFSLNTVSQPLNYNNYIQSQISFFQLDKEQSSKVQMPLFNGADEEPRYVNKA